MMRRFCLSSAIRMENSYSTCTTLIVSCLFISFSIVSFPTLKEEREWRSTWLLHCPNSDEYIRNASVNRRLDEWVSKDRLNLDRVQLPQSRSTKAGKLVSSSVETPCSSRASTPDRESSLSGPPSKKGSRKRKSNQPQYILVCFSPFFLWFAKLM